MLSPMRRKKRMAKEQMTVCTLPVAAQHTETTETLASKQISPEGNQEDIFLTCVHDCFTKQRLRFTPR